MTPKRAEARSWLLPINLLPDHVDSATISKQMRQLVQLRTLAMLGQLLTILLSYYVLDIDLPLRPLLAALLALGLFNGFYQISLHLGRRIFAAELLLGFLVDIAVLSLLLYLSGGVTNPFVFLYVLQVGLAAVLMAAPYAWGLLVVVGGCFLWLADAAQPLQLPLDYQQGLASLYVMAMFICLLLTAALLVVYVNRFAKNRREYQTRLEELRRRAAEEEHILRMGLLASGAAHELGTPLATIAVILGDWRHMPKLHSDEELSKDIEEIQIQVERCKRIVSGILLSAGEARGESSGESTVCEFFDELVSDWRQSRKPTELVYQNQFGEDMDIASDTVLKQTVCNLLDNALEASPDWLSLEVSRQQEQLQIRVCDRGPGFSKQVFSRLGQPYQSTKQRPGSGLGLFLVFNVTRTLGGKVQARNLPGGGAEVLLRLPLNVLQLKED